MHPEQKKIYKSMTAEKKLDASLRLYYSAWEMKAAGFRKQYPDLDEEEIQNKVKEAFSYART
jgi:hypothetical protein